MTVQSGVAIAEAGAKTRILALQGLEMASDSGDLGFPSWFSLIFCTTIPSTNSISLCLFGGSR